MAQLFDIKKVTIGPRALVARVELAPSAPLMTSDDPEGTERVLTLMPGLAEHACLGDASASFGEVAQDTEFAHLLEHVTVELLAQTDVAGDISCGQTTEVAERAYEITLSCPDDVLVAGALSSAAWVLQWAYSGGGEPEPDIAAIAQGLADLVQSLAASEAEKNEEPEAPADEPADDEQPVSEEEPEAAEEPEVAFEPEPAVETEAEAEPEPEPEAEPEPASEPASDVDVEQTFDDAAQDEEPPAAPSAWDMNNVPRPHLVR